ncbi:MAG: 2-oxo-4-hydroxy-4-carboxy-5-ureidoimidazoline decarboxylase [Alphaproteobacteria bacterium]|nr:2-oxo-4-hydroxy-4-carboxy-5-ureidoimidazoline decarboxylase [Alphaproteobacteria bacterium SS10]
MPHPMVAKISIAALNAMPKDDFVAALRPIFDEIDDPWIAERAWTAAPFRDVASLHQAMVDAVDRACTQDQMELLARQDDLENRKNGLYFRRFSPEQQADVRDASQVYEETFGYPFLCACHNVCANEIHGKLTNRLKNPPKLERITALSELAKIAKDRLQAMVVDTPPLAANAPAAGAAAVAGA